MEGRSGLVIHDGSLLHQHIHRGGSTNANSETTTTESRSGLVIHEGSLLHQHIYQGVDMSANDEGTAMEVQSGPVIHGSTLLHQPPHHSGNANTNNGGAEANGAFDQGQQDEDDDMSSKYHSFDEHSETDTIMPSTQPCFEESWDGIDEDYTIEDDEASPSSTAAHTRDEVTTDRNAKKPRSSGDSARPGFERGSAKYRSAQNLSANRQLVAQVRVLKTQLVQEKQKAKAELMAEFDNHISRVDAEVQARENARINEWLRLETLLKQREEAAAAEKERAAQAIKEKDAEAEAFRAAAVNRENEMREHMLAMMKANEELRRMQAQSQKDMAEHFEQLKKTSVLPVPVAVAEKEGDLNRLKECIIQTEATTLAAKQRATSLEAIVRQKDEEVEVMRVALSEREAAAKEVMESLMRTQEELRQNQIAAQQEVNMQIERLKADKEREVATALQQKKRSAPTVERPKEYPSPHDLATNDQRMADLTEPGPSVALSFPPAEADHQTTGGDKSSPDTPHVPAASSTSAKDLMTRINNRKALAQRRNIPVLRRAPAVENEEDGGDEHSSSEDDDEEDASPKGKGRGKLNLDNFQDIIIGAVRQAIVEYAPEIGISISTTPKETRVSSQRAAISAERKTHSQPVKTRISKIIRNVIQDAFKIDKYDDFCMHVPATVERILLFNKSGEQCPDPRDLHIDMQGMISSTWNKAVIQILLALVNAELDKEDWLPACSDTFLRDKIQKVIEKGRALWHQTESKVAEDGKVETVQQVEDRIIREKAASDARARAYARRSNKFATRCKIVDYVIERKIEAGGAEEDIALWKWLRLLLEKLGKEGMSSEESEVEEGSARAVYYVKKMPWRKTDATKHVRFIDKQRDSANGMYARKGNQPVPRIVAGDRGGLSRRPAPPGRPRTLYEEEWLKKQHPSNLTELQVSNEKFVWREFYPVG
ncbi:hypothetical protein HYPSUDRAFT_59840 [Hypholoma sublateritium FD-334 SS-4]|uniref:Uncharacterized protein n=1 Tax=Hypholoma sublateritium (strain FD-334 SS-4) TaxID=945553 RepID=A0A0D2NAA9_HYPSF|nr:hypothetical protein HYPSUDRAFT_59840 [Hypholoma sublateritium FD-334 SS-4]